MTDMFNNEFDPLADLDRLKTQMIMVIDNDAQIARAYNDITKSVTELYKKVNEQTHTINLQNTQLQELHDRLRLLEISRQHEKI